MDYFTSPDRSNRTALGRTADGMNHLATLKTWNVSVRRNGESKHLGLVHEKTEDLARCAALSKYGVSEDEAEDGTLRAGIYPADDFDVSPA